ncbi:flavodoxin domain-containing protein [Lacticaseibacillus baoqingensis]|uniref:Flavodoxin domain-containing protein n=1 Tax=Lacticaseibacillus baoqingensis TaxID=2486013 RepID=A0ABW4E504_9LACO|nr:flavodoxin domain-containing protein [Lacticaseibacillus baoqingensis]
MKVLILYASITGNAKGMARILTQFFEHAGASVSIGEMQQTDAAKLAGYDAVILSTYTWSGGVIPEETQDFYADLQQLDFSQKPLVFGIAGTGDKFYGQDRYNTAPDHFEAVLTSAGAIKGADSIKIEQGATQADMPAFAAFTKAIVAKVKAVQQD